MTKVFQCAVLALIVAFCFGQLALAENNHPKLAHHWSVKAIPASHTHAKAIHPNTAFPSGLYGLTQALAGAPADYYATPTNGDNTPLWPCFGGGTAEPNSDCLNIGDPAQDNYGVELGAPFFTWPLSLCKDADTATIPCGETETFYESDSSDSTDFLAYELYAKQGTSYVVNGGIYIAEPNAFPAGSVVVWSGPNFMGTGACVSGYANTGYPIPAVPSGTFACHSTSTCEPEYTYGFVVPPTGAAATCVNPVATTGTTNEIDFESVTELVSSASSKFKLVNNATTCADTGTAPYCYTFTVTPISGASATQKWSIAVE